MQPVPKDRIDWSAAPAEHFTGDVEFGPVRAPDTPDGLNVLAVRFQPGARTDWHDHPAGQVLHVVEGACRVGTRDEVVELAVGDSLWSPPGELHWHGAVPEAAAVHLSITSHGATRWTDEKVSDADYGVE